MNVSIHPTFVKTAALNGDLDNKVLMIFIILIAVLVVSGVIFFRFVDTAPAQSNQEGLPSDYLPDSSQTLITV